MDYPGVAVAAAEAAGELLAERFKVLDTVEDKGAHDLVTAADRDAEQLILKTLKQYYPHVSYVAEESGRIVTDSEYVWYVDPIDGTANFVTGNPYFSVSIALAHKDEVIVGVVHNPITKELYVAERGSGAVSVERGKSSQPLRVSDCSTLIDALVATAYAADNVSIEQGLDRVKAFALATRKTMINFSPALDLCNVARGRLDALIDAGTTPEDHAAGSLIVQEAGGGLTNFASASFDVEKTGVVAASQTLWSEIQQIISR